MTTSNDKSTPVSASALLGVGTIERLNEQVKIGHQAWVERLREMQELESVFTKELLAARDPNEALAVCNRWIAKRLELLSSDSKAFSGFWMDLVMTAASGTNAPWMPPSRRKVD